MASKLDNNEQNQWDFNNNYIDKNIVACISSHCFNNQIFYTAASHYIRLYTLYTVNLYITATEHTLLKGL